MTESEITEISPPINYQEWLALFARVKNERNCGAGVFEALSKGSLEDLTPNIEAAFKTHLVETVNTVLDRSAKRFVKEMNESITFNDLCQMDILFIRLKRDVKRACFFEEISFLPADFRRELSDSLKKQMSEFWNSTVKFLYGQSLEFSNSQLEDALYTVRRIKLFE